jgi:hypothetical protein
VGVKSGTPQTALQGAASTMFCFLEVISNL